MPQDSEHALQLLHEDTLQFRFVQDLLRFMKNQADVVDKQKIKKAKSVNLFMLIFLNTVSIKFYIPCNLVLLVALQICFVT